MKVLAIDLGEKRVGLAVSDPAGRMAVALPLYMWKGDGNDVENLAAVAREQGADKIVVGLPLNMNGTEGAAAQQAREFGGELQRSLRIPVEYWDERLTSEEAADRLKETPIRGRRKREHTNTVAAQIILESYLQGGDR